jgi:hypothetical protein
MQIVETAVKLPTIKIVLADNLDGAAATERIELEVPIAELKSPTDRKLPLAQLELQYLAEVQGAALLRTRDVIDTEIRRLRDAARHSALAS